MAEPECFPVPLRLSTSIVLIRLRGTIRPDHPGRWIKHLFHEGNTSMAVKAKPDGYPVLSPYLVVDGAEKAIEFYSSVFGFQERMRIPAEGGRIGHAELANGDSLIMLADEVPSMGIRGPKAIGGSPITLQMYVDDVDHSIERAVAAGAKVNRAVANQFYGDRTGSIEDPFGHIWHLATHVEDVSHEEMIRRASERS